LQGWNIELRELLQEKKTLGRHMAALKTKSARRKSAGSAPRSWRCGRLRPNGRSI
jgi:hypothetical protein